MDENLKRTEKERKKEEEDKRFRLGDGCSMLGSIRGVCSSSMLCLELKLLGTRVFNCSWSLQVGRSFLVVGTQKIVAWGLGMSKSLDLFVWPNLKREREREREEEEPSQHQQRTL